MGLMDKIMGKQKKAVGEVTDDPQMRREGQREERKGEKKEEMRQAEEKADRKADEVADLERKNT